MRIEQNVWREGRGWEPGAFADDMKAAHLVLVFGAAEVLRKSGLPEELKKNYPQAKIVGCSTSGEIFSTRVLDNSITTTAVLFQSASLEGAAVEFNRGEGSFEIGRRLVSSLKKEGLRHVFVLSDGIQINGSELVRGMKQVLPIGVNLTGGLAGDGSRFKETLVIWDGKPLGQGVVALGFYGASLHIGYGSFGGWDPFGPERLVTKSTNNILYEMDGKSALELYKTYLGEHAVGLPATGLLFPLSVRLKDGADPLVRTILSVDEDAHSMTFAGDVPEGSYVRLMKANVDRLIDGATEAAKTCEEARSAFPPDLAILISCVGRKLVLKQRVEEEVEGVHAVFGDASALTGFYSYGEISPFKKGAKCALHNQTMTVTSFKEV